MKNYKTKEAVCNYYNSGGLCGYQDFSDGGVEPKCRYPHYCSHKRLRKI